MQEDNFHVDILAILMQEILEEVRDRLVSDVPAHDNMSANTTNRLDYVPMGVCGLIQEKVREIHKQLRYIHTLHVVYVYQLDVRAN